MKKSLLSRGAFIGLAVSSLVMASAGHVSAAAPTYNLVPVGPFGGEPSITGDSNGVLYDSTPSGVTNPAVVGVCGGTGQPSCSEPGTFRSYDLGQTWSQIESPDPASGDTCITTDQGNSLYWCNLAGTQGSLPLQADVWKSTNASMPACTTNAGSPPGSPNTCLWAHGNPAPLGTTNANPSICVPPATGPPFPTSCSIFGVDRQWTTAWIPPAGTTANARVVIMYHDFYGPSQIWVNVSNDGGATFGSPIPVMANPAMTPAGVTGSGTATFYSMCNTVPSGIYTKQSGTNAGRIYVSWIAADVLQNAGGCNISMAQSFHDLWVSWSDNGGLNWTSQQAYDGLIGHDASTPFASFTSDNQGNPYISFADNLNNGVCRSSPSCTSGPQCATQSASGVGLQTDTACESDMYVVWSADGGVTWDGGGGVIPGSAAFPYRVNTDSGTHWFPTIAAGDPGKVDVSYLRTSIIQPTDAGGKALPGACAGPITGNPPTFPPACVWDLYAGQSLNLQMSPGVARTPGTETWVTSKLTSAPMHLGDICNLGIACGPTSDRSLLDFNMEVVDPQGCAHIAYSDNNAGDTTTTPPIPASPLNNHLAAANQLSGPSVIGTGTCSLSSNIPEVVWPILLPAAGTAAVVGFRVAARRRRRQAMAV